MRHEFKIKDALREEKVASKRDERRAKQKDARGQIGMGLLGSGGMFNTNQPGLSGAMVSSLVSLPLDCLQFTDTYILIWFFPLP